jgi:hypothetical protein
MCIRMETGGIAAEITLCMKRMAIDMTCDGMDADTNNETDYGAVLRESVK